LKPKWLWLTWMMLKLWRLQFTVISVWSQLETKSNKCNLTPQSTGSLTKLTKSHHLIGSYKWHLGALIIKLLATWAQQVCQKES
jgi:hypothetical protein